MKSIEKVKLFILFTLVMLIIYAIVYDTIDSTLTNKYLKKDFAYTISNSISLILSGKGGKDLKYTFFFKGKLYTGHTSLSLRTNGTKYFIKIYPPNPNRNKATEIIADSTDVENLPSNGYKKLPHN